MSCKKKTLKQATAEVQRNKGRKLTAHERKMVKAAHASSTSYVCTGSNHRGSGRGARRQFYIPSASHDLSEYVPGGVRSCILKVTPMLQGRLARHVGNVGTLNNLAQDICRAIVL